MAEGYSWNFRSIFAYVEDVFVVISKAFKDISIYIRGESFQTANTVKESITNIFIQIGLSTNLERFNF